MSRVGKNKTNSLRIMHEVLDIPEIIKSDHNTIVDYVEQVHTFYVLKHLVLTLMCHTIS